MIQSKIGYIRQENYRQTTNNDERMCICSEHEHVGAHGHVMLFCVCYLILSAICWTSALSLNDEIYSIKQLECESKKFFTRKQWYSFHIDRKTIRFSLENENRMRKTKTIQIDFVKVNNSSHRRIPVEHIQMNNNSKKTTTTIILQKKHTFQCIGLGNQ